MDKLNCKLVMCGPASVGKTCLSRCFCERQYHAGSGATVSAAFLTRSVQTSGGYDVMLGVWDTAGQDRFDTSLFFQRAQVCLLCYDVTDQSSLDALQRHLLIMRAEADPDCITGLVGCKLDAIDPSNDKPIERQITEGQVRRYAEEIGASFIIETSAATMYNVDECFQRAVDEWWDRFHGAGSAAISGGGGGGGGSNDERGRMKGSHAPQRGAASARTPLIAGRDEDSECCAGCAIL